MWMRRTAPVGIIMRKAILLVILLVLATAAAGGGYYWWTVARFVETTDDAYVRSDVSLVSPKIEGYVREVRAAENQLVKEGDVLVVIDDEDYAARARQAEAALNAERATLATYDSRIKWQQSMIDQAAAQVRGAEADLKRAQQDHERYRNLLRDDFASRQRYETAEADSRKAEAALAKARAQLAAETNQLAVFAAQRVEAEAKAHQAEAALTLARNNLADTVIRAPVDGVVGNKGVQVGHYVTAGTQLLSVVPLPEVYVTANFKETQLARVRPGQPVLIEVDAYKDRPILGTVESFAPATGAQFSLLPPENATGNFTKIVQRVPVRIAVPADNPLAALLRPGLSVVVSVDTRQDGRPVAPASGAARAVAEAAR
jgi:membrane fusion protein, multidrug efflux system